MEGDVGEALALTHVTHPDIVAIARVTAADYAETVLREPDDGQIGSNTTCLIEEVRVDPLSSCSVPANLCDREVFHEGFSVRAFNIVDGEV